ncbi:MAG: histidine phosphatase family protein [Prevotella sp.]|nr:histidine phosphatase family protein [Prevotella sp.]
MIYVVRHGQTDWNLQGRCQGWHDIALNQTGLEQATKLAEMLADVKFDVCFSSPLKRALKTTQTIYDGEIIVDQRIKERGKGKLEGRTDVRQMVKQMAINYYDPNENRYGIERLADFEKRVHAFLNEVLKNYVGKNVLVVTHGGVAMCLRAYLDGIPENQDFERYRLENCEIWQIDNSQPLKIGY